MGRKFLVSSLPHYKKVSGYAADCIFALDLVARNLNFEFSIEKVLIYLVNRAGIKIPDTQNLETSFRVKKTYYVFRISIIIAVLYTNISVFSREAGFSAQSTNECILRELQYKESKYMTYLKLFTRLLYVLRLRLLTQNL